MKLAQRQHILDMKWCENASEDVAEKNLESQPIIGGLSGRRVAWWASRFDKAREVNWIVQMLNFQKHSFYEGSGNKVVRKSRKII